MRSGSVPDCLDAALADRNAFIDAGQVERMLDPHFGEQRVVGKFVDLQDDIGEMAGERLGQAASASRAMASISSAVGGWSKRRAMAARHRGRARPIAASLPPRSLPKARFQAFDEHPITPGSLERRDACGAVAEWSKALAWKVSIRQNRIEGSNPSRSAISILVINRRRAPARARRLLQNGQLTPRYKCSITTNVA